MVVSFFYHATLSRETKLAFSSAAASKLYRNVFPVFRVWVAASTTAGNVSSAFSNCSIFSPEVDSNSSLSCSARIFKYQNTSKYYYNFLNVFSSLYIDKQ